MRMEQIASSGRVLFAALSLAPLWGGGCDVLDGKNETAEPTREQRVSEAVTLWTDSVELFFEHPPLVAGRAGEPWAIHLTALRTFQPISEGRLTLRFQGPEGREYVFTANAPVRSGIFTPSPSLPGSGTYHLSMELQSPQASDLIDIGAVRVYASEEELPRIEAAAGADPITFLKEQQWEIAFATVKAALREIPRSLPASGEIIPPAGRLAKVAAPVAGLVLAEANLSAPAPGEWVEQGETLAVLSPVGDDNSYAALRARVERLEREVARAERLYAVEAIPERRLEEARYELEVAQAALESMGGAGSEGYSYHVRAPIAGAVNERHLAPGDRVEAGELLFTIVDPRTVWLQLYVPARHALELTDVGGASFTVEGSARVYWAERIVAVGSIIDPETRTISVLLDVQNPDRSLKIGMLADTRLFVGDTKRGVAVPTQAILNEDRISIAYVQSGGESFQRRVLTLGPSDGEWTMVESGVQAGERVVAVGAYQVRLASLQTSEIAAEGHAH